MVFPTFRVEDLVGFTVEDFIGTKMSDYFHPAEHELHIPCYFLSEYPSHRHKLQDVALIIPSAPVLLRTTVA